MWKSTGWFAKQIGVTRETVVNWIHDKKFDKIQRTEGGHYRIWSEPKSLVFGYCRVSSIEQSGSLTTQERIIRESYPDIIIRKDIGAGFDFQRKAFKALLEQCMQGVAIKIVATTSDRITRSGFPLIKWIVELYGGEIIILENSDSSKETFDTESLISFISTFINSYHGKRSSNRNEKNKNISQESEEIS
jgi:predicted site-specific integrase-resolvase